MSTARKHTHGSPAAAANPGLDQLAAQIRNDRKGRHPVIVGLEPIEQQILPLFVKVGGEQVDPHQAGITMLVIGQLLADVAQKLPAEHADQAPAVIINLLRMVGQRLYSGDALAEVDEAEAEAEDGELRCPFPLPHGAPCNFKPSYTMGGTLTTVMRGHVALHHPGETWPPVDEDQAAEDEAYANAAHCSACGAAVTLEDEAPLNPAVITAEGVQCIGCASTGKLRGELPDRFAPALKRGDIGLTGRFPSARFEPGFDAHGNITELSIVTGDGERTPVIPSGIVLRVPAGQCTHPKHARMHLPGGQRCAACGTKMEPFDLPHDAEPVAPGIVQATAGSVADWLERNADETDGQAPQVL